MSRRADRVLTQVYRYAEHRRQASTAVDKLRSAAAFAAFAAQFDAPMCRRMDDVYRAVLAGGLMEDRRRRSRRLVRHAVADRPIPAGVGAR